MRERIICLGTIITSGQTPQECLNCPLRSIAEQVTRRVFQETDGDPLDVLRRIHTESKGGNRQRFARELIQECGDIAIANLVTARRSVKECPRLK